MSAASCSPAGEKVKRMVCHRTRIAWPLTCLAGTLTLLCMTGCTQGSGEAPVLSAVTPAAAASTAPAPSAATSTTAAKARLTYQVGPFALPARTSTDLMRDKPGTIHFHVDEPIWVTGFVPKIQDGQGNALPGQLLHLAVVSNLGESNPLCSARHTGNPFAAATAAMKRIDLPEGHGYPVLPEDQLEATVILRNPTDQDYHEVYFSFDLVGEPLKSGKAIVDVAPLLLDIDPCDHAPLAVEPKAYLKKSQRFSVPEAGILIQAHGLLQDYGVEIELGKESDPKPFWKAAATINAEHQIIDLPSYADPAGIQLHQGDAIVLGVSYENFQETWYNDATAAAMVYIARTGEPSTGPTTAKPVAKHADAAGSVQSLLLK